jgi:hypothetical protein
MLSEPNCQSKRASRTVNRDPARQPYPLRMSTAVALTASSIRTINKEKMLGMLRRRNKTSNSLVTYLLSSLKNYRDHVADRLTSSAERCLNNE